MWQKYNEARKTYLSRSGLNTETDRINRVNTLLYEILQLANHNLPKQDFLAIINGKHPKTENELKALDLYKAYNFVQSKAESHTPINADLVQQIAAAVMRHTGKEETTTVGRYDTSLGDFRLGEDYAETYPHADFRQIPDLLETLCKTINDKLDRANGIDIIRIAAKSLYEYAYIEPFGQGNLETGLLFMNYIVLYHNEPLIIIPDKKRTELLNALKRDKNHPTPEILEHFLIQEQIKFFDKI